MFGTKETRTDALCTRLIVQAEIARWSNSVKERSAALRRISDTLFLIARPKFDPGRLARAFEMACIEGPDYGSPVARTGNKLHLNGIFDLDIVSHLYFAEAPKTIEGEKNVEGSNDAPDRRGNNVSGQPDESDG